MTHTFHPDAELDIAEALDFYGTQAGPLVARRFLAELERVVELLDERPGFGTPASRGRRVYPLRTFPYSVVYRVSESGIRILVVRQQHRRPGYGGARR